MGVKWSLGEGVWVRDEGNLLCREKSERYGCRGRVLVDPQDEEAHAEKQFHLFLLESLKTFGENKRRETGCLQYFIFRVRPCTESFPSTGGLK